MILFILSSKMETKVGVVSTLLPKGTAEIEKEIQRDGGR